MRVVIFLALDTTHFFQSFQPFLLVLLIIFYSLFLKTNLFDCLVFSGSGVYIITVLAIIYHAYIGPKVAMKNILLTNSSPVLGSISLHAFISISLEIFFLLYATTNGQSDRVATNDTPAPVAVTPATLENVLELLISSSKFDSVIS